MPQLSQQQPRQRPLLQVQLPDRKHPPRLPPAAAHLHLPASEHLSHPGLAHPLPVPLDPPAALLTQRQPLMEQLLWQLLQGAQPRCLQALSQQLAPLMTRAVRYAYVRVHAEWRYLDEAL